MPLIIPPGFLHAAYRLRCQGDTEDMITTCGHAIDAASGANGEDAADDLMGAFGFNIVDFLPPEYSLIGVDVYVGQDASAPLIYTSTDAPVVGTNTGSPVPQNTAWLIRKRTDLGGRRGRGRMYIPGVQEGSVDAVGNLSAGALSSMQGRVADWYESLTAQIGARLYPPVVLHRSEGIGVEPVPTPITSFQCDPRVATQRRRLRP